MGRVSPDSWSTTLSVIQVVAGAVYRGGGGSPRGGGAHLGGGGATGGGGVQSGGHIWGSGSIQEQVLLAAWK